MEFRLCISLLLMCLQGLTALSQTRWYNPMDLDTPPVQGRWWNEEIGHKYNRLPDRAASSLRPKVWNLSKCTAGLFIEFHTNASNLSVRLLCSGPKSLNNVLCIAKSGIDLYRFNEKGEMHYCAAPGQFWFGTQPKDTIGFNFTNLSYHDSGIQGYKYRLFLPLYNDVRWLSIGVPERSYFKFEPVPEVRPIAIYGTSITQGASASRPAMAWTNIVQRKTNASLVNLGFSGNGLLEPAVFDLLAEIPARLFIIDCTANMQGSRKAKIVPNLIWGVKRLRKSSNAPILIVEHAGRMYSQTSDAVDREVDATNMELRKGFKQLVGEKITNLYYLTKEEIGLCEDGQTDGLHASDLGMTQYANAFIKKINEILSQQ